MVCRCASTRKGRLAPEEPARTTIFLRHSGIVDQCYKTCENQNVAQINCDQPASVSSSTVTDQGRLRSRAWPCRVRPRTRVLA